MRPSSRLASFALAVTLVAISGCDDVKGALRRLRPDRSPPDSLPRLINDTLPFSYPPDMYVNLIDDSLTLRLHVDEFGKPVPESTRIEIHAKRSEFDSAALKGAPLLLFRPAIRRGDSIPYTVLFPIRFKVPLHPLPPDTGKQPQRGEAR